ncbi:MAG: U32 family peptidase [Lachnospiraceae bacterium]|nr:U32 family peptidase [Lachnospiraceae bacterium]
MKEKSGKLNHPVPELLSPAGDTDCLNAALAAGCDAVYAGIERFGARAYAGNFTSDEFIRATDRMHVFGKKLYLTLNTLIKPEEFEEIYGLVRPLYEAGLDGVIVQDMGIISLLKEEFGGMEIHASTQMSVSSVYGARLLKDLGVSRIVTSRELSLDEVRDIHEEAGVDIECFIHGAMCYSYSGMCLMSSFLGGRSGNRGRCAGPCRQPYSAGRIKNKYLLSMKDLCVIDMLDELIDAGIASFKIEGRMKSPAYVYGVTEIYRRNMDSILENPDRRYAPSEDDRKRLVELYSRGGISDGYYHRHNGLSMMTLERGSYKREDKEGAEIKRRQLPLRASLRAYAGSELQLEAGPVCDPDITVTVTGDVAEQAKSRAMTASDFKKQLSKTGDSDFYFDRIEVATDESSFVRISSVNDLRRRALAIISERLTHGYKRSL